METWLIITFLLMYALFEFMAAFSFNYKIKMIQAKKYVKAASLGAFSTVIFTFLTSFASFIALIGDGGSGGDTSSMWWFIIAAAFMMAIGNILAMIVLKPFEAKIKEKQEKKMIKEKIEEGIENW